MAEDSLAPRGCAANVSRRALLGGIAAVPFAGSRGTGAEPLAWEQALHAYAAAQRAHEVFLAKVLRPAYRRFDADLARERRRSRGKVEDVKLDEVGMMVRDAEREIVDAGGDRAAILALRAADPNHANARKLLARDLSRRRLCRWLMRLHRIYELEDRGNDLASVKSETLFHLIAVPSLDRDGVLLKMRLAYEDILGPEDHDGVVRMIFADVKRLWN